MGKSEVCYKLALSRVDGIGPVKYKKLMELIGNAEEVFSMSVRQLKSYGCLTESNCMAIKYYNDFRSVQLELEFANQHNIKILDIQHPNYPQRLKLCVDSPSILFLKGNADLNAQKVISVIGTRMFTDYGRRVCEELVEGLKSYNVLITSGLAFGIDAIAHKASIRNNLSTVGVVAHGLKTMYPAAHRSLAGEMIQQGGILSEYFSDARIDKGNFPSRNRIVAGMADATVIVETDVRGGSMITAEIAYSYNRDVFCFPGRVTDHKSNGCNFLIKSLKAQMITSADDIAHSLGWTKPTQKPVVQRQLFVELNEVEQQIISLLQLQDRMHIDEFYLKSQLNSSQLSASLLSLEMQQIVKILPGKLVCLM